MYRGLIARELVTHSGFLLLCAQCSFFSFQNERTFLHGITEKFSNQLPALTFEKPVLPFSFLDTEKAYYHIHFVSVFWSPYLESCFGPITHS